MINNIQKKRIALLFGSFNPIHYGHLNIGKYALDNDMADEVRYIVSPQNPLKSAQDLAPFEHRYNMAMAAVSSYFSNLYSKKVKVSDIENSMPLPSYTFNTIKKLIDKYGDVCKFSILCGSDIDQQLDKWYRIDDLKQMVDFLIYPRILDPSESQLHKPNSSEQMTAAPIVDIQACNIRKMFRDIKNHRSDILKYIPVTVLDYISENNIY